MPKIFTILLVVCLAFLSGPAALVQAEKPPAALESGCINPLSCYNAFLPMLNNVNKDVPLVIWTDGNRVPVMTELGKQFTADYHVPVVVQQMGFGEMESAFKNAASTGGGPDIIVGAHDWLGELVTSGLLEPLDLGGKAASFEPTAIQAFTYNGKLYGMPYSIETVALIYNKDLVPTPPATWDALKTTAQALKDAGKVDQGYVLQWGDAYHFESILTGFGGYIFKQNPDGTYDPSDVGLDSAGGLAAARELDSMVKAGLLSANVGYNEMAAMFNSGRSAMMIGGPWMLPDIKNAGINYGIANIPTMAQQPRPFVGVQGFMINAYGKNRFMARSFLNEYIATDAAMQALYDAEPRAPAWMPILSGISDPDLQAFAASAATGQPMPAIPEMSSVWAAENDAITSIFLQQKDPAQAFIDAAQQIRGLIAAQP